MYAKVFAQMYDGTLCTRGPWQALVTFQQLLVLADQEGNVDMTEVAISRRTTIPVEIIHTGIVELLKEDDESRTPTMEGRRIIPLAEGRNWGWHIVNYKHYRELKREEDRREYHRGYWNNVRAPKLKANKATQQHSTASTKSTYAYAEAEAKEYTAKFLAFWSAYPKKKAKGAAAKAFAKTKAGEFDAIMEGVASALQSEDWTKSNGQFIPHPATWLNDRRWEDQITDNVVDLNGPKRFGATR